MGSPPSGLCWTARTHAARMLTFRRGICGFNDPKLQLSVLGKDDQHVQGGFNLWFDDHSRDGQMVFLFTLWNTNCHVILEGTRLFSVQ